MWALMCKSGKKPRLLKCWLSDRLREKFRNGEYRPGSLLEAERTMSTTYGVSRCTVRAALEMLEREGLIQRQPGRG